MSNKGEQVKEVKELQSGVLLHKFPCPSCLSNDNLLVYVKHDDNGNEYLDASCMTPQCENKYMTEAMLKEQGVLEDGFKAPKTKPVIKTAITKDEYKALIQRANHDTTMKDGSLYRSIKPETAAFYGHLFERDTTGEIIRTFYPETKSTFKGDLNSLRGYKSRDLPKTFGRHNIGIVGTSNDLSGAHKFTSGGKWILVVGGEEDKLAAAQMLRDYQIQRKQEDYDRIAVVGIHCGEGSLAKVCANSYDFLDTFEEIILCMDNDEAGRKAVQDAVKVLPENKVKVMTTSLKDCSEMLQQGKQKQFISDFYGAKPLIETGIKSASEASLGIEEYLLAEKITLPPHLHRVQDALRGGIRSTGAIVNIIGNTSVGKCLGKDTPILMYDFSVKKVQDVVEGDLLMGDDGTSRKVVTLARGREKMYKISQVNGMTYTVNASHILSLRVGYTTPNYTKGEIVNINVEDYLKLTYTDKRSLKGYKGDFTNYQLSDNYESRAYLLGLWLAEGCCSDASVTVNNEMLSILESEITKTDYTLTSRESKSDKCSTLYIKGGFKQWLREIGVLNNKHIPDFIFSCSVQTRYELIAGYLDGDGYKVNNGFEVIAKQDKLSETFMKLCKSVSLTCTNRKIEKSCQNDFTGVYNRMFVFGATDLIPNKLTRKKVTTKSKLRYGLNTKITVDELGEDEYYGFVIDGNHLFCLEDGTVTHNTFFSDVLVHHFIFNSPLKPTILSIERTAAELTLDLYSYHLGQNLTWFEEGSDALEYLHRDDVKALCDDMLINEYGEDRMYVIDDREGTVEVLKKQIERAVKQYGSKLIVLDVLTDVIRSLPLEDQEAFMAFEKQKKKEGVVFVNILHTRKPSNEKGEQGFKRVNEYDILGSGTIPQSADINIVLNRNKMATDPIERNTTYVDIPKCRGGMTGSDICKLYYDPMTRRQYDLDDWLSQQKTNF